MSVNDKHFNYGAFMSMYVFLLNGEHKKVVFTNIKNNLGLDTALRHTFSDYYSFNDVALASGSISLIEPEKYLVDHWIG